MPRTTPAENNPGPDGRPRPRKPPAVCLEAIDAAEATEAELSRLDLALTHVNNYLPGLVVFAGGETYQPPAMAAVADELPDEVRGPFLESLAAASRYITHCFRVPGDVDG